MRFTALWSVEINVAVAKCSYISKSSSGSSSSMSSAESGSYRIAEGAACFSTGFPGNAGEKAHQKYTGMQVQLDYLHGHMEEEPEL